MKRESVSGSRREVERVKKLNRQSTGHVRPPIRGREKDRRGPETWVLRGCKIEKLAAEFEIEIDETEIAAISETRRRHASAINIANLEEMRAKDRSSLSGKEVK